MYDRLFSPLQINSMTVPNRFVVPAMVTRLSGEDGFVNREITDRYVRFAQGEIGLIVVEAMAVHGAKSGPLLRISDDSFTPGLRQLAQRVHDTSESKILPQIIHFLKISRSGWRQKIDDLSVTDIRAIIRQFAEAGARAKEAGFDGVELHMAHAYTLSSFLSKKNKRADDYGGRSLQNRVRLPIEVLHAVRKEVGDDFTIGVRFLGEECIKGGYTTEESSVIALQLARNGADYISLSAGGKFEDAVHKEGEVLYPYTGYSGDRCMPPMEYPDGYNLHMAERATQALRAAGLPTPVIATGKISTAVMAEDVLASGKAEMIGMARQLLADPDMPKKVREGREEAVVKCIYWNVCKALDETFHKVVCGLWPKEYVQAPFSTDTEPPIWSVQDSLKVLVRNGNIRLNWKPAADNEAVMGYEIWRSANGGVSFEHIYSVAVTMYTDNLAIAGSAYQYYIRAYDLGGNKSSASNIVETELPLDVIVPERTNVQIAKPSFMMKSAMVAGTPEALKAERINAETTIDE